MIALTFVPSSSVTSIRTPTSGTSLFACSLARWRFGWSRRLSMITHVVKAGMVRALQLPNGPPGALEPRCNAKSQGECASSLLCLGPFSTSRRMARHSKLSSLSLTTRSCGSCELLIQYSNWPFLSGSCLVTSSAPRAASRLKIVTCKNTV